VYSYSTAFQYIYIYIYMTGGYVTLHISITDKVVPANRNGAQTGCAAQLIKGMTATRAFGIALPEVGLQNACDAQITQESLFSAWAGARLVVL
jgi:hypothetical protein